MESPVSWKVEIRELEKIKLLEDSCKLDTSISERLQDLHDVIV